MSLKSTRCDNGRKSRPPKPPELPRGQSRIDPFIEGIYKRDCPAYSDAKCKVSKKGLTTWCKSCPHNQKVVLLGSRHKVKRPPLQKALSKRKKYLQNVVVKRKLQSGGKNL